MFGAGAERESPAIGLRRRGLTPVSDSVATRRQSHHEDAQRHDTDVGGCLDWVDEAGV
jgi:hypothetical protein